MIDWRELLMLRLLRAFTVFRINRLLRTGGTVHPFTEYFKGFEKIEGIREIFGEETEEILKSLKVEFTWAGGYMWVNGADGHLMISSKYLNNGDKVDIYLDIIHELVHVKQFMNGKELFDVHYGYAERPTEVEAYRHAVDEAKRLGLSDERICRYLRIEWMSDQDFERLAKTLNIDCSSRACARRV
jgi:hypothetical protein